VGSRLVTPEEILELVREFYRQEFASRKSDPQSAVVHYSGRIFDEQEMTYLVDASLHFYLTANRYTEQFERRFARYMGLSNCVLVNSGSSANLLAISALTW
jgi:CDP-6-deoxy-D-xylo-4-hexulose-3-dehydrase